MTTGEALNRMHKATPDEVRLDPDMVFGYSVAEAVVMLHGAISCERVATHFVVRSTEYDLCVAFGTYIEVSGPARRAR